MKSRKSEDQRLPRVWLDAWRSDEPRSSDVQRAYQRFLRSRWQRSRPLHAARWLFAGLVLGLGAASAASDARLAWFTPSAPARSSPLGGPSASRPAASPAAKARPSSPALGVAAASLSSADAAPSAAARERPAASATRNAAQPTPVLRAAAAGQATETESKAWRRAAESLRANDVASAEAALLEIEARATAGQREAARLARAELLLHSGRTLESRLLLDELARDAGSASIRRQAQALAKRSAEKL